MIPTYKPYQPPKDREYRGTPDKDLPVRYKPRDSCYIGITTPRDDEGPAYRRGPGRPRLSPSENEPEDIDD